MLQEARRVAAEFVVLDAGRPEGVADEEWQDRSLPDGSQYRIDRRHFDAQQLVGEIGATVVFAGRFYVMPAISQNATIAIPYPRREGEPGTPAS